MRNTYTAEDLAAAENARHAGDFDTLQALEYKRFRSMGYDTWTSRTSAKRSATWKLSESFAKDMNEHRVAMAQSEAKAAAWAAQL